MTEHYDEIYWTSKWYKQMEAFHKDVIDTLWLDFETYSDSHTIYTGF